MEQTKRKVKFQKGDAQSALLWLMSNSGEHLYDEFGTCIVHSSIGNTIEISSAYYYENEDGEPEWGEDFDSLSYEDFVKTFNEHTLETI
jgi:hypothetical protein